MFWIPERSLTKPGNDFVLVNVFWSTGERLVSRSKGVAFVLPSRCQWILPSVMERSFLSCTDNKKGQQSNRKKKKFMLVLFSTNEFVSFVFLSHFIYCKSFYVSSKVHFCVNAVLIFHTYSDLLVSLLSFVFLIARLYIFKEFFINLVPLNLA